MITNMDYRKRMYQNYVTQYLEGAHSYNINKTQYDFIAMKLKKQFKLFIPQDKTTNILDLACGTGHFLYFLQKEGYANTLGIDISQEQVAMATQFGVNNVQVDDLFSFLPKHLNEFDMILASHIIEHLTKDEIINFLDCIYRALKPNGTVLIGTLNAFSLFGASCAFGDFTHEVGFTPISLTQVLRVCGFNDIKIHGEQPVALDFRGKLREILWWVCKKMLLSFLYIERGYGREMISQRQTFILEPRIFAVARKL
jgi:2-polyprenyl-3-methyl-5-hydroxy-6-metoxy-1,4-benzoquinol methylase